jgi:glycosyltransferase involved in cell wall biosynthesis
MTTRILSAILFSPRGGSAHAARALTAGLRQLGCAVTLVAGSRSDQDAHGDAQAFYGDVHAVGFDAALATESPQRFDAPLGSAPMHPSFEDRAGAPDRVFAKLDDEEYELQVAAWSRELQQAGVGAADVIHVHHLTPLNEAAARVAPGVPVVSQLHGTELLMLEQIAGGRPDWPYASQWARRMRNWARASDRLVVAPSGVERAVSLLDVPRGKVVAIPNGVDLELFNPRTIDRDRFWRRVLIEEPRGWLPGQPPGSVCYSEADVAALAAGAVLLCVGRFTAVKRLDRLIAAFGRAQRTLRISAGLVLVGGHPGEWEGEHPAQIAERLGVAQVFLAGWQTHDELPDFFSAADVVVLTSEREQFGQVIIEGMACGLPAVATRSLGPAAVIDDGKTGWLVDRGDDAGLASALADAVQNDAVRQRRGQRAQAAVRERYSWAGASQQLASVLAETAARGRRCPDEPQAPPGGNGPRAGDLTVAEVGPILPQGRERVG